MCWQAEIKRAISLTSEVSAAFRFRVWFRFVGIKFTTQSNILILQMLDIYPEFA
jgi:head-tail adaptor